MKPSPLLLKWVTYPAVSYRSIDSYEGPSFAIAPADVEATVDYRINGEHLAHVELKSRSGSASPYEFSIVVLAQFSFDLDMARQVYKPSASGALSEIIAVNISRILYASAREMLALITSRAPYQTVVLESALLEPKDVKIRSDESPLEILGRIFGASEDEVQQIRDLAVTSRSEQKVKKKASSKKAP